MPTSAHGRADVAPTSARPWADVGIALLGHHTSRPPYLALIPGYREPETLKPGIIPGNPVYLADMQTPLVDHRDQSSSSGDCTCTIGSMESCIKELLSFTAEVRGIKFYPGYEDFRNADARGGFLHVDLRREADNTHDKKAVLIVTRCRTPRILRHLERRVAAAVARIIDLKLPYTRMKRLLLLDNYIIIIYY